LGTVTNTAQYTASDELFYLGAVHKRRPHSGGFRCGHFVLCKKNFGFFEIYSVFARTGGEPVRGRGQFFEILCRRLL